VVVVVHDVQSLAVEHWEGVRLAREGRIS